MMPSWHWLLVPADSPISCPSADYLHPGGLGQKIMSDLAVMLIQETVIDLLMFPWGQQDQAMLNEPMPPPMYPGARCAGAIRVAAWVRARCVLLA
jgi:hypothetical protein